MTIDQIRAVIVRKRIVHPELQGVLGWHGLQRIFEREQVSIIITEMPRPAQLIQYRGRWAVLLDANARRHLAYALHELGHLWLHHDTTAGRWERVYNMDEWEGPDPREEEAEVFVALVLQHQRDCYTQVSPIGSDQ